MIPLSYAAILGGTCSLIGTSTNLIVAGLVQEELDRGAEVQGLRGLEMFDITSVGLPCTLVGAAFLLLVGPRLLPNRGSAVSVLADVREYTLEMIVPKGSNLVDRSIEDAGLRSLPGAFLVEVERRGQGRANRYILNLKPWK